MPRAFSSGALSIESKLRNLYLRIVLRQRLRDRRRQRRLAVIDMPDRPNVYVRLAAVKFLFRHIPSPVLTLPNRIGGYLVAIPPLLRLMISSAKFLGTSSYCPKCMVKLPRPCVRDRTSVA